MNKQDLINRGKELGINLKRSMSIYELKHRIKEAEENQGKESTESKKSTSKAKGGEY